SGSFVMSLPGGETRDAMAYMELKQKGSEIEGTAGESPDRQWAIRDGRVEGKKITFEVQTDEPLFKFELALVDGHLKGEAKAEHEGTTVKVVIDLQRQKE